MTRRTCRVRMPRFFSNVVRFSERAVMNSRSPSRSMKSPPGVMAWPPRSTAQTSTLQRMIFGMSTRRTLRSLLLASTRSSTISVRPLAKVSLRRKPGYFSSRSISVAAWFSGLMSMDRPKVSRILKICSVYSGFRTRAMVWSFWFMAWAVVQQSRFTSSAPVAAMSRSASFTPACRSTSMDAQLP